ncbi:hypothetical protein GCM10009120_32350 [Sphingobacterium siyangense subsp. cladoniae]
MDVKSEGGAKLLIQRHILCCISFDESRQTYAESLQSKICLPMSCSSIIEEIAIGIYEGYRTGTPHE